MRFLLQKFVIAMLFVLIFFTNTVHADSSYKDEQGNNCISIFQDDTHVYDVCKNIKKIIVSETDTTLGKKNYSISRNYSLNEICYIEINKNSYLKKMICERYNNINKNNKELLSITYYEMGEKLANSSTYYYDTKKTTFQTGQRDSIKKNFTWKNSADKVEFPHKIATDLRKNVISKM